MDNSKLSAETFDKLAHRYQERNANVTLYEDSNALFCARLATKGARVLDAACGPGTIARYLLTQRPDLNIVGIDLAPTMIELARANNPSATFAVHDCRDLLGLGRRFDGIVCGFGLPYLSRGEAAQFIADSARVLDGNGILYVSTMEGPHEASGFETMSSGDRVFVNYHSEDQLLRELDMHNFKLLDLRRKQSPGPGGKMMTDLLIISELVTNAR